ncbi:MAG: O-antigen ligase family protein [Alphaproteobacteria bacterium]|nr:O-antigen ligase family protein [Alphaproteobacteria bacterium]MDE2110390.1 O-antigen ligase family protein [Alphaproteobacteria bacterium]MDE2495273.1 O-antigen ligase family protein [Alphaproteobacteria bacterium]
MRSLARGLIGPIILAVLALAWGVVQIAPLVPQSWMHPVWQLANGVLGRQTRGVISLDPWRSETELMKLLVYAMAAWLARAFAYRPDRARVLLHTLIAIGGFYAAYALVMASLGIAQFSIFYVAPATTHDVSGPFVNHNSYATYAGLITLCTGVRLVEAGSAAVSTAKGARRFALTLLQYLFGRGVPYLAAAALAFSSVIATTSRAGNFATLTGMASLLVFSVVIGVRQSKLRWVATIALALFVGVVVLFAVNGNLLVVRLDDMAATGVRDDTRLMLWNAALHMIENAPLLGLGLGTYQDAYPMYADTMMRFIMDKAHNDYLELAAGWGLPAAILWWSAIGWLALICVRGVLVRRRHRVYAMLAIGATVLVGAHSVFDFSLQMPAIALAYATILGLGIGQAFPTRRGGDA